MKTKQAILKKWKYKVYGLAVLIVVQALAFPMLCILLRDFIGRNSFTTIVQLVFLGAFLLADLYYCITNIVMVRQLLDTTPIECQLEDIFMVGYKDKEKDGKMQFRPFLIARSLANQKLYVAYDKHSLLGYTTITENYGGSNFYCTIRKSDGTTLKLGDPIDMYLMKPVNVRVFVNHAENTLQLNGKKIPFHHMNSRINIEVFEQVQFFKGVFDVDAGQ